MSLGGGSDFTMSFIDMSGPRSFARSSSESGCGNARNSDRDFMSLPASFNRLLASGAFNNPNEEETTEGYSEVFDPPLDNKYECPICLMGLREPVQTICGHRFCHGCIKRSLRDSGMKCPVDQEHLDENQLFPDKFTEREILCFTVLCHHKKKGCPWKGMLQDVKKHLAECEYEEIKCPNNCGYVVERRSFENHLKNDCPDRPIECQYCNTKILFKNKEVHEDTCPYYLEECPNGCSNNRIPRQEMKHHLEVDCPKQEVDCPFSGVGCTFVGLKEELRTHLNNFRENHMVDLATAVSALLGKRTSSGRASNTTFFEKIPELVQAVEEMKREMNVQKDNVERLYDLCKQLQERYGQIDTSVTALKQDMNDKIVRYERLVQELSNKSVVLERKVLEHEGRSCNGLFYWKIKDFNQSRENAIRGINTAIHSPPFHSSFYGYKMCIRSNLNGVDSGFGTHISMFIHLMKGEWDDLLEWPFQGRIVLTIMDQSTNADFKMHASETLHARPGLVAFNKPTAYRSLKGYGYVEFLPLQSLSERCYVKDDTMIVKVQVFSTVSS